MIALTYRALNGINMVETDIRNSYLQAPPSQKEYIICGPEFGLENAGKKSLIRRALYGGKSGGRNFKNNLHKCMCHLHFQSCPADPDFWMIPEIKYYVSDYYEYILL